MSKWFRLLLDFLTPRMVLVIVLWARAQCHIGSRMHNYAYTIRLCDEEAACACPSSHAYTCPAGPCWYPAAAANKPRGTTAQPLTPRAWPSSPRTTTTARTCGLQPRCRAWGQLQPASCSRASASASQGRTRAWPPEAPIPPAPRRPMQLGAS